MSLNDKLIRHQIFLERYSGTVSNIMQRGIDRARDIAIAASFGTQQDLDVVEQQINTALQSSMNQALEEIKQLADYENGFAFRTLNAEIEETINQASDEIVQQALVNKVMPVGLADNRRNRKIEPAYNQFANENTKLFITNVKDAQREDGFTSAEGIAALAAGLIAFRAKSLARASTVHASNVAKDEVYKANKEFVTEVEWVSVLDSRTTAYCRGQNGKKYPVGSGPRPPAHYNCRSITRPVIDE